MRCLCVVVDCGFGGGSASGESIGLRCGHRRSNQLTRRAASEFRCPPMNASVIHMNQPLAIFLMGPTASGKTGVAVELVQRLPLEIISVDSALIYRGMDIGTAKPDAQTLALAPHRLIDIRDPSEIYSAAEFRHDALQVMDDITSRGNTPLLVGGTTLYFRALEEGLSDLPSADPEVRAELEAEAAEVGWAAMHARLSQVDPEAAARIHPNDPQRIQRALEVYELCGEPMSALFAVGRQQVPAYRFLKMALVPGDRALLHVAYCRAFSAYAGAGFSGRSASFACTRGFTC